MSNNSKLFILSALILISACSKPGVEITAQQYAEKWPFSVSSGRLECKGQSVIFHAEGVSYAVNGVAKQNGYAAIEPIWKQDPSFLAMANEIAKAENKSTMEVVRAMGKPPKINITPILNSGLKLCK
jgi:hypothetical protein